MESGKRTVLIADDDVGMRMGLQARLSHAGYAVLAAGSGADAIRLFGQRVPDAVILDAAMPDKSGFEVCDAIRATDQGRNLPVIFLTGAETPSPGYVARCANAVGGSHYLRKPCDTKQLLDLLATMIS